jgi:hypothetical protein
VPACSKCGFESEGAFKFCPECGAEPATAAIYREQRKIVTELFCDLTGSTALGEMLDPARLRALLARRGEHSDAERLAREAVAICDETDMLDAPPARGADLNNRSISGYKGPPCPLDGHPRTHDRDPPRRNR